MHKRKQIVFTGVALLLIGSIFYGYRQLTGESTGTILAAASSASAPNKNQSVGVSDQYAHFAYGSDYLPVSADPPSGPILARHLYSSQEFSHAQLAIQVTHLANTSLNDDGSYTFRNTTTQRFNKEQQQFNGNTVTVFTDTSTNSFSRVAYLQHGSLSASVALTSAASASDTELQQEFTSVLNSWQWH